MTNNDPRAAATTDHQHVPVRRGTFELRGVYCLRCAGAVERVLREQPYITEVQLDWKSDVVHVGYDPASIGPEDIEQVITQTGCDCSPAEVEEEHHHEAMAPP
jgi:copper chaperone CopZ